MAMMTNGRREDPSTNVYLKGPLHQKGYGNARNMSNMEKFI